MAISESLDFLFGGVFLRKCRWQNGRSCCVRQVLPSSNLPLVAAASSSSSPQLFLNMELRGNLSNGGTEGDAAVAADDDDVESFCSTPCCSAPSSPRAGAYFFSAPASPVHFVLSSSAAAETSAHASASGSFEFEFSARGSAIAAADEIFLNGQIQPMKLSSHLQHPQIRPDLPSVDEAAGPRGRDPMLRSRSIHRRARSMSPLRNLRFPWQEDDEDGEDQVVVNARPSDPAAPPAPSVDTTPASSSSRSSSASGRSSKRWIFLKDLLHRSKSEGRGNGREKFWMSLSFSSPSKERSKPSDGTDFPATPPEAADLLHDGTAKPKVGSRAAAVKKLANGVAAGRVRGSMMASAHERHYTWNRAQAEEMRRRTFLPYRHGVLGFLGFGSRGYGGAAGINGFARTPNPVSSR